MIIGITGRVGSGKSMLAKIIKSNFKNLIVFDLDEIGHKVLFDEKIKAKLVEEFGKVILDEYQNINRNILGKIVFSNKEKLQALNSISHPEIKAEVLTGMAKSKEKFVIIAGALIKEIGLLDKCNKLVVVDADDNKIKKLIGEKFKTVSPHQQSRKDFLVGADVIIKNNFDEKFFTDVINYFKKILKI
jgi:dephospho-CoA kinase